MAQAVGTSRRSLLAAAAGIVLAGGCRGRSGAEVHVYSAQDQEFAEPLFKQFATKTGMRVLPKWDAESTKTVGLVQAVLNEGNSPRADVFWCNEPLGMLRLAAAGRLAPHTSAASAEVPSMFKDPAGRWQGFAGRLRVLLWNTKRLSAAPVSIHDLLRPEHRGQIGQAKPLFGTTATQAACLFAAWGEDAARAWFSALAANGAQVLAGNRHVAEAVAAGDLAIGLTDTDDALGVMERGAGVAICVPDQMPAGDAPAPAGIDTQVALGALMLPNVLAMVRNCRNSQGAAALIDWLLSKETEAALALGPSGQIPLNPACKAKSRAVPADRALRMMPVSFADAERAWAPAMAFLREKFLA